MNPFFSLPAGPPPMCSQQTRYLYRTRDGGPPNDGKPPAPPGPPPPYPGFPFGSPMPGPPPPGPFCFGPPPPGPPPPGPFCFGQLPPGAPPPPRCPPWMFQPPPAPPAPGPPHLCFQNPAGTTCVPAPPAAPPAASVTVPATPASATYSPATYQGPVCHMGGTSGGGPSGGLAPGNRVNERVVKADDGSGILLSPDQTCFHVLEAGQQFGTYTSKAALVRDVQFKVQYADSDWSVEKVINLLGGLTTARTGTTYANKRELIGIQEWHEATSGCFTEGTLIMLNDPRSKNSLRDVGWGPDHGRAGQKPPVWVMLWPVKGAGE